MSFTVCPSRVVLALSDALDLVGVEVVQHGKRVAIMAMHLGRELGWSEADVRNACLAGLLHDFGVSSTAVHRQLVENFAWEGADEHCERGYQLLHGVAGFSRLAGPIRYHHTPWSAFDLDRIEADTALLANTLFLADRVDAFARCGGHSGCGASPRRVIDATVARAATTFAPELVAAFGRVAARPATWYALEPHHVEREIEATLRPLDEERITARELREIAEVFARVVDFKSPFTQEHSHGVARLARLLAELCGLAEQECELVEVAGLLHDIGKLRVPDAILDKPDRLSRAEVAAVTRHPYETYGILSRITCLPELAPWAGFHHEALTGDGYPFRLAGDDIPRPARVVAVADVVQALVQDRPYRGALPDAKALDALRRLERSGRLERPLLRLVIAHADECLATARKPAAA